MLQLGQYSHYCECIAGNQSCLQRRTLCSASVMQDAQTAGPDISQLDPVLQKQWDHAANKHLGLVTVKPYSGKKAWWLCDQCPDGHLHSWAATILNRSNGQGCPQCAGRKVCKHSSVATKFPLIAAEWHPTNNDFQPEDVTAGTNKPVVWQCRGCSHVWIARVRHRTALGSGCPECNTGHTKRAKKRHPTFAECNHPLLAEWDHARNAPLGVFPNKITLGKQIFWLCPNCPSGKEHSYSSPACMRTGKHSSGCLICAGHIACNCNSLQTRNPDIAAQWDFAKNDGTPDDYTARSTHIAWWISVNGWSWLSSIYSRTVGDDLNKRRALVKKEGL